MNMPRVMRVECLNVCGVLRGSVILFLKGEQFRHVVGRSLPWMWERHIDIARKNWKNESQLFPKKFVGRSF